jgi:hypothetical protein
MENSLKILDGLNFKEGFFVRKHLWIGWFNYGGY